MKQSHYNELMKIAADLETEGDGAIAKALRAALASDTAGGVVGEAGNMPGTDGFTMACFEAAKVPVGTKLYAAPVAPPAVAPLTDGQRSAIEYALSILENRGKDDDVKCLTALLAAPTPTVATDAAAPKCMCSGLGPCEQRTDGSCRLKAQPCGVCEGDCGAEASGYACQAQTDERAAMTFEQWIESVPPLMWESWGRREAAHAAWLRAASQGAQQ